jgi:hypothetical protein
MTTPDRFEVVQKIVDSNGNHLMLRYIEVSQPKQFKFPGVRYPKEEKWYDFHSLVWESHVGSTWQRKATLTQADLEQDGISRWVAELNSFDASAGTAILKFGEGEWNVTYSWREWDLRNKKELRTIKVCDSPFDPFDG